MDGCISLRNRKDAALYLRCICDEFIAVMLSIPPVQADEFFRDIKPVGSEMMADAEKSSSMAVICRKLDQHDLGLC